MIITLKAQDSRDIEIKQDTTVTQFLATLTEIDGIDWSDVRLRLERTGTVLGRLDRFSQFHMTDGDVLLVL